MRCPNCGAEQPEAAKFCGECGFSLAEPTCPRCGGRVSPGDRYCGVCGADLLNLGINSTEKPSETVKEPVRTTAEAAPTEAEPTRTKEKPRRKAGEKTRKRRKPVLIIAVCLLLAAGGVIGGSLIYKSMQADSGEDTSYGNLLILTDTFTDRTVTDEASAILAAQDAAESLGLQNAMEELEPLDTAEAYGDTYYRLQQYYEGYPVYGRAVVVLADENGEAFTLVGNVADVDADLSFTPSVTQTELEESLSAYAEEELELSGEVSLEEASDDALVIYDLYDEETHLAYELSASLDEEMYTVVLDANDGEVLVACETLSSASITGTNSSGTVTVNASVSDENEGTYFLYDSERKISILDLDGTTSQKTVGWSGNGRGGDSSDAEDSTKAILGEQVSSTETNSEGAAIFSDDAINYLDTLSKIYDTYENWGINSLYTIYANYRDGFDSGMNAVGGVVTVDGTKIGYISAGLVTGTSDIDVYAHEYAHYIMSSHIPLTSSYSTAIKEGFADIYGCLVECKIEGWDEPDWSITGDNITVYRDMAEPSASGNAEYWDVESSSEHEYDESTIISHAAYLMWRGKDSKIGIGQTYGSLSVDELAELWYRAMLMFPTDCDYNHVCQLVELAAEHMSLSDQQKECISWAFYQVGIAETYTLDADFNLTLYDTNGDSYAEYYASVEVILSEETLSENTAIVYEPGVDGILSFHLDSGKAYKVTLIDNQDDTKKFLFYAYITDKNGYDTLTLYTDFGTVKTGTLSGTIVSASDSSTAIGGASVTVLDGDTVVEELTADENGAFEAELIPGTYTVQIEMEGYQSVSSEVTVVAGESTDILISLPAEISDADARAAYWAFLFDEGYADDITDEDGTSYDVYMDDFQYAMYDLNGDGISELLLHGYVYGISATYYIYGYDGDVFFIGSCDNFNREGTYYSADENALVIVSSGGADWITYEFYEVSDQLTLTYTMKHQFCGPGLGTVTEDNPDGYEIWSFYITEAGSEQRTVTEEEWNSYIDNLTEIELLDLADAAISVQWDETTEYRDASGSDWGYYTITGCAADGTICWTVTTADYEIIGDAVPCTIVGENDGLFYYFEYGDLIALDIEDGSQCWRIDCGLSSLDAWVFGGNGTLYAGGFCTPNFIAVSQSGAILTELTFFADTTYLPTAMQYQNGTVTVTLYPFNSSDASEMIQVTVATDDFSYEIAAANAEQQPFYGVWCAATKKNADAQSIAERLRELGFDAQVCLTSNWEGLNSEAYYAVTAGLYATEAEANAALAEVQAAGYSSAYVKYSGDWRGNG